MCGVKRRVAKTLIEGISKIGGIQEEYSPRVVDKLRREHSALKNVREVSQRFSNVGSKISAGGVTIGGGFFYIYKFDVETKHKYLIRNQEAYDLHIKRNRFESDKWTPEEAEAYSILMNNQRIKCEVAMRDYQNAIDRPKNIMKSIIEALE